MDSSEVTMNKPHDKEHGEGNYKATQDYNDATRKFIDSGKVEEAADKAKPKSADEARQMTQAEQEGKSHSKGEDSSGGKKQSR
jgi:hypothetical protein